MLFSFIHIGGSFKPDIHLCMNLYKRKSNKSLLLYENMVKFCRRTNILQQYSRHFPTGFCTHCSINIQLLAAFIFYSVSSIHTKLSNKGTFFSFHISSLPFLLSIRIYVISYQNQSKCIYSNYERGRNKSIEDANEILIL